VIFYALENNGSVIPPKESENNGEEKSTEPITPVKPVTPEPVKPKPVTPEPVKPVTPEPVKPKPVKPVTPQPVKPVTPEPVKPVTPEPEKPKKTINPKIGNPTEKKAEEKGGG
jgi:hypothetical protein